MNEIIVNKLIKMEEYIAELEEFAEDIAPSTGIRNRLVHEYESINDKVVYQNLDKIIKYYLNYIKYVNQNI